MILSDPVGVPTPTGYEILLLAIVILVQLGSDVWGGLHKQILWKRSIFSVRLEFYRVWWQIRCWSLLLVLLGAVFALAYTLAQTSKIVCVWFILHLFESWVVAKLAPLEALYRFLIQYMHGPVKYELRWIAAAVLWSRSDCCGEALFGSSVDCNRFVSLEYGCVLCLVAGLVGNRCVHLRRWVPRSFWTAEIVLDFIYVAGWGVGSWGHHCILLMPLWSGRFVDSCILRRVSDIRLCYLRNGMRLGRRDGFFL